MSTEVVKENIAPLVQRILADPLQFTAAKRAEHQSNRPQSYVKIGATHSKEQRHLPPGQASDSGLASPKEMASQKKRPASLAQALAGYTGKRVFADEQESNGLRKKAKKQKKVAEASPSVSPLEEDDLGQDVGESLDAQDEVEESESGEEDEEDAEESSQESSDESDPAFASSQEGATSPEVVTGTPRNIISKKVFEQFKGSSSSSESNSEVEEKSKSDEDEDEEDDDDYVEGATKSSDSESEEAEASSSSSEEADEEDEDDDVDDDVDLLKADLLSEKSTATTEATTPPTSPESDDAEQEPTPKGNKLESFYGINEIANDRGSNGSKRIVKNWGPQLTKLKPSGLLNHGVTCYTNAAVQAMVHIPAVQHYLNDVMNNKYKDVSPRSVSHVLAETSARMWKSDTGNKYINPKKLIGRLDDINCMMSEWQQEDSHEYFMSLLSRLQEDSTPKGHKLNESIIYDIFGGLLNQSVTCKNCGHVSKTQQEFYDLSVHLGASKRNSVTNLTPEEKAQLNIHDTPQQIATSNSEQESKQRYSIQKSIKDFFSPELIKPDRSDKSGYVCEKCKQRTNAIKISSIDRAPETLAVHLKRFRFNGSSSSKVKQGVSYPLVLDLTQYTTRQEPVVYQLISVVVHEGRSVSSGHYIAHCRQPDGSWATYDDEYINSIPEKQALRDPSAYYLIYTRLTHKDIIPNPQPMKTASTPVKVATPSPSHNPHSTPSSPAMPSSPKFKKKAVGIITPTSPKAQPQFQPRPLKQFKKQKMNGMVPTNNLGNVGGKNKRYNSKKPGNGANSKRFKRY